MTGVRAVAIAAVLLYHLQILRGGFLGVDVFFVLSGFLITTLLLEEADASSRISLRRFYRRRVRRLGPPFVAAMLLPAVQMIVLLHDPVLGATARNGLVSLAFTANVLRAGGHVIPATATALWSLAEEEQFYLLWPLVLIVLLRRRVKLDHVAAGLALLLAAVVAWRFALTFHGASADRVYFGPDTHCDGLLAGCVLAVARRRWGLPKIHGVWAAIPAAGLLGLFLAATQSGLGYAASATCAVGASAALIMFALTPSFVASLLALRPMVALGVISYALYLWQGVVFSWAGRSWVTAAVAVVLAAGSYRYIEAPLRRRARRVRAVAAAAAVD